MHFKEAFSEILRNPYGSLKERGSLARLLRKHLSVFVVNSGNWAKFPELTMDSANFFPSQIIALSQISDLQLLDFDKVFPVSSDSQLLATHFDHYGSDKSSHGYERIYSKILASWVHTDQINLLEIGIGTNSPGLISSMGKRGKPGASLRSFVKYDSRLNVIGADVDKGIHFNSERIQSFYLDQNRLETYDQLSLDSSIDRFDLIIDDGLHSTFANINTLIFSLSHLKFGGYLIIEDIPDSSLVVWNVVLSILTQRGYEVEITRALRCNVVILKNNINPKIVSPDEGVA